MAESGSSPPLIYIFTRRQSPQGVLQPHPGSVRRLQLSVRFDYIWRRSFVLSFAFLGSIFATIGSLILGVIIGWLLIPGVKYRDFTGIYLLASALRYGIDITLPLTTIGERLGIAPTLVGFYHPTPHPPTMGLLLLPFAYIDYTLGSLIWLVSEFLLWIAAVALLARLIQFHLRPLLVTLIALALVAWDPVFGEFKWGQVGMLLLFLYISMLLLLKRDHPGGAGVLFGLALLIKPLTVPVAALLLLRRQWRMLGTTLATVVAGYSAALLLIGPSELVRYFTQSLPAVGRFYSTFWPNISLATLGSRLFESMWLPATLPHPEESIMVSDPLIGSPLAAQAIIILLPLLVISVALWAVRWLPLDRAIASLVCISIAVSPISWVHYEVLALPLVAQTLAWLRSHRWPRKPTLAVTCILLLMLFPLMAWLHLGLLLTRPRMEGELPYYPAVATLPVLIPGALLLSLVALGIWIAHRPHPPALDADT